MNEKGKTKKVVGKKPKSQISKIKKSNNLNFPFPNSYTIVNREAGKLKEDNGMEELPLFQDETKKISEIIVTDAKSLDLSIRRQMGYIGIWAGACLFQLFQNKDKTRNIPIVRAEDFAIDFQRKKERKSNFLGLLVALSRIKVLIKIGEEVDPHTGKSGVVLRQVSPFTIREVVVEKENPNIISYLKGVSIYPEITSGNALQLTGFFNIPNDATEDLRPRNANDSIWSVYLEIRQKMQNTRSQKTKTNFITGIEDEFIDVEMEKLRKVIGSSRKNVFFKALKNSLDRIKEKGYIKDFQFLDGGMKTRIYFGLPDGVTEADKKEIIDEIICRQNGEVD